MKKPSERFDHRRTVSAIVLLRIRTFLVAVGRLLRIPFLGLRLDISPFLFLIPLLERVFMSLLFGSSLFFIFAAPTV
jgi:hypothetical protein